MHVYFGMVLVVKNHPTEAGDARDEGSIPGLGGSPGVGNGTQLLYFLPGKFHVEKRLAGYSPWCLKESDTTERLSTCTHIFLNYNFLWIYPGVGLQDRMVVLFLVF